MKSKLSFILSAVIVLAVFNVIAFVVPFQREDSFWIGYAFTMLAFIIAIGGSAYAFSGDGRSSKFYGISLVGVLWSYLLIQMISGLVFMIFPDIPQWVAILTSVLILAMGLLGAIADEATNDHVKQIDREVQEKTFYIRSLQASVEALPAQTQDATLRNSLRELAEDIRYSDPMSAAQLASLENRIEGKTAQLTELVVSGDAEAAKAICAELRLLLAERNRQCRILK